MAIIPIRSDDEKAPETAQAGLAILELAPDMMVELLCKRPPDPMKLIAIKVESNPVPADAMVLRAEYDILRGSFQIVLASSEFGPVPEGACLPRLPWPTITISGLLNDLPEQDSANG